MIDAHCHLEDPELGSDELANRRQAGGQGWFCAGFGPERWPLQKAIQGRDVWHAVGLHPWSKDPWDPAALERELSWAVAVGECGLDYAVARTPEAREQQGVVLSGHLSLARKHRLPVVLHVVRAHRTALQLLEEAGPIQGMVHGFAGSADEARDWLKRGLYLSLGPFSLKKTEIVASLPADRILAETDAPGRGAHLADLARVLEGIAAARGGTARDWAEITHENFRRLLNTERT